MNVPDGIAVPPVPHVGGKHEALGPSLHVSKVPSPYTHLRLRSVLDKSLAARALIWLGATDAWRRQTGPFYRHDSFSLTPSVVPSGMRAIVSAHLLTQLGRVLTESLWTPLRPFAWVEAHRASGDDYIGLHTDGCMNEVRLMLNLNRPESLSGGVLTLQDRRRRPGTPTDYVPVHNSATAFRTTPSTYHQVSRAGDGARFTLLYRFPIVRTRQEPSASPKHGRDGLAMRTVITTMGAHLHRWPANAPGLAE